MVEAPTWDELLIRYGRAMIAAQRMERAMFALLLTRQQADAMGERLDMCVDRVQTVQSALETEAALALHTMDLPLVPDPASSLQVDVFDWHGTAPGLVGTLGV